MSEEGTILRREKLLSRKREDLARVIDRHDDLVREAFHLQQFTTLIGFDPVVAKADKSAVFETFRADYDLVANLNDNRASTSMATSPGRKTRRSLTGKLQSLIAAPNGSPSGPPLSPQLPHFSNGAGKGKGKEVFPPHPSGSPAAHLSRRASAGSLVTLRGRSGRLPKPSQAGVGDLLAEANGSKYTKSARSSKALPQEPSKSALKAVRRNGRVHDFPPLPTSPIAEKHGAVSPPSPVRPRKRIRLIVKPPLPLFVNPPQYTHPAQIPPSPAFGNSVTKFLDSYINFEDDEAVPLTVEEVEDKAWADAQLLRRAHAMRVKGYLKNPLPALPEDSSEPQVNRRRQPEPPRPKDHWDHLIAQLGQATKQVKDESRARLAIARKINKMVGAYWEKAAGAQDREKRAEEKRVRTLAKSAAKAVQDAWKVIVKDVRDAQLELQKEEQVRQGRRHLNRILQQSSQVLEAQHMDLRHGSKSTASLSRDGSVSLIGWGDGSVGSESRENTDDEHTEPENGDDEDEDEEQNEPDEREPKTYDEFASLDILPKHQESLSPHLPNEMEGDDVQEGNMEADNTEAMDFEDLIDENMSFQYEDSFTEHNEAAEGSGTSNRSAGGTGEVDTEEHVPMTRLASKDDSAVLPFDHRVNLPGEEGNAYKADSPAAILKSPQGVLALIEIDASLKYPVHSDVNRRTSQVNIITPRLSSVISSRSESTPILTVDTPEIDLRAEEPRRRVSIRSPSPISWLPPKATDDEFVDQDEDEIAGADLEMDLEMEAEEQMDDSDDSELEGLEQDADLPIDELMRIYGYAPREGPDFDEELADKGIIQDNTDRGISVEDSDHTLPPVSSYTAGVDPDSIVIPETPQPTTAASSAHNQTSSQTSTAPSPVDDLSADAIELDRSLAAVNSPTAGTGVSTSEDGDDNDSQGGPEESSQDDIIPVTKTVPEGGNKIRAPFLLRGTLRPYQHAGLEWLASLYANGLNGILADEMGLGKTIQTISLLAYLACEKGIWGPHLVIVPTSVLMNWQMEFKKFLPGFKTIAYYGPPKQREKLRIGWNTEHSFNVCITSYQLVVADEKIFRRKAWQYMILDEAHNIKNFQSKRWKILLGFNSVRRLLLTGTPLQNNLSELWSLLGFLMPTGVSQGLGENTFANHKEFAEWFSNPLIQAIESGKNMDDEETRATVTRLHTLLRPYILRRLKADVEKQLPGKYEHLVYCRLSKRQRFLYDEFMSRASTKETLASNNVLSIVACLMQLRKVCNHPDLFESRPIVTSFAMTRSAIADYEIKDLLVRRNLLHSHPIDNIDLDACGLHFILHEGTSIVAARGRRFLDASSRFPYVTELPGEPPPTDMRTIQGYKRHWEYQQQAATVARWRLIAYVNRPRCFYIPAYSREKLDIVQRLYHPLSPVSSSDPSRVSHLDRSDLLPSMVLSYTQRAEATEKLVDRFGFVTPKVVALDLPRLAIPQAERCLLSGVHWDTSFDIFHPSAVKLQIQFPDAALLQYDCGKLQELASLLRERKAGGHKVLIFTQMTKVLDVLEVFLSFNGYRYLRLDGSTKTEDRPRLTERFNVDPRVFAFISSSRAGGIGINLTGADTVIFYDSDYNPSMDKQCEDRAHRIGQVRDVHIYRFISRHTVEESMLKKANQKRSLDDLVIQKGEFDWRKILDDEIQISQAFEQVEDKEDVEAARNAAKEISKDEIQNQREFEEAAGVDPELKDDDEDDDTPPLARYMMSLVKRDWEFFSEWRVR